MKTRQGIHSKFGSRLQHWACGIAKVQLRAIVAIAILYAHTFPLQAQNYDEGMAAFRTGDFAAALSQLRPLARQGHARAQYDIGNMSEYGRGIERSDIEAVKWYRKAARQGVAAAQYRMAVLHENGWGVPGNDTEAVRWYAKAADQGHTLAQHDLAFMYVAGTGVPQDYVQAYMWLQIAVLQGNGLMSKHLKLVAGKLALSQIETARGLARKWMQQHPK